MNGPLIYKVFFIVTFLNVAILSLSQQKHPTAGIEPYYDLHFTQAEPQESG